MRFLGKLVLGLLVLLGVLAVAAYALPREIEVNRSVVINAPAERIFPHINDLRKFTGWSPWAEIDPKTTYDYSGPDAGTGQKVTWASEHPDVGSGSQTIVESVQDRKVVTALDFGDMGNANARFDLDPEGSGTRVTWQFDTDMGNNPMMRWMGLMFDRWIGADYEKGLAKLKARVESG